jgi:hypothetical protein
VGPTGKKVNHIIFTIMQTARLDIKDDDTLQAHNSAKDGNPDLYFKGGANIIFDLDKREIRYSISKPVFDPADHTRLDMSRLNRQIDFQFDPEMNGMSDMEKYFDLNRHTELSEPFALLHNH